MNNALIIVDVQNDFISGSLAVDGGEKVAEEIARYIADEPLYDFIVATMDWHIDPGDHFSDEPDYKNTWPRHCVAGTEGALLHEALSPGDFDQLFPKGKYSAAYSGFEGIGLESQYTLAEWLEDRGVTAVDICGIATDYCVKATALDAVKAGFETTLLVDLCAAVSPESGKEAIAEMNEAGVWQETVL